MLGTAKPREHRHDVGTLPGLRRVEEVRVFVGHGHPVAVVTGVVHRYPRRFRISMATAARLARSGVPVHIEQRTTPELRTDARPDDRKVG
jgi:hypothetical protein